MNTYIHALFTFERFTLFCPETLGQIFQISQSLIGPLQPLAGESFPLRLVSTKQIEIQLGS